MTFDRSFNTNVKGPYFLLQELLPVFANPASIVINGSVNPHIDGLYLGKLAAARGGESQISTDRWTTEADRVSFAAGFREGYQAGLARRAPKASAHQG